MELICRILGLDNRILLEFICFLLEVFFWGGGGVIGYMRILLFSNLNNTKLFSGARAIVVFIVTPLFVSNLYLDFIFCVSSVVSARFTTSWCEGGGSEDRT